MNESLLSRWKAQNKGKDSRVKIAQLPEGASVPLSHGQQRLWFLQQLYPDNPFYNYSESFDLKGPWNIDLLKKSLQYIFQQHDILRSHCVEMEGQIFLEVDSTAKLNIDELELSVRQADGFSDSKANVSLPNASATKTASVEDSGKRAKQFILEQARTPFQLDCSPLIRVSLLKMAKNYHVLSLTLHHIITDEWSMEVLVKQLAECYRAFINQEEPPSLASGLQFRDYAYWDRSKNRIEDIPQYWKDILSGPLPVLDVSLDFKRPLRPTFKGKLLRRNFSAELSKSLFNLAAQHQVTPFVLIFSLFNLLLYRHTGQTDLLVGSPMANRDLKELEDMLGFFVETLVLRTKIKEGIGFGEFVDQVRSNVIEAFANKNTPFDALVKELNPDRMMAINPFFQVMFVYNTSAGTPDFGRGLFFAKNDWVTFGSSKFDLTLFVTEENGMILTSMEFATDLFEESTVNRFLEHLELLARSVVEDKERPLNLLPMLTDFEKDFFFQDAVGQNAETITPKDAVDSKEEDSIQTIKGIYQLIEEAADKYPNHIAVTFGNQNITYHELINRVEKAAGELIELGIVRNDVVGLMLPRSIDMIVGLLAILKSGAAYLPLDPEYPQSRINYMLEDAIVRTVLTNRNWTERFNDNDNQVKVISEAIFFKDSKFEEDSLAGQGSVIFPKVDSEDLAYVIYTSGSSGKPKGVPITQRNILRSTLARIEFYPEDPAVFLLLSSISFDSSKAGLFWTLATGGNLIIAEKRIEQDMVLMESIINDNGVTHTLMLPTLYQLLLTYTDSDKLKSLSTVIVAGEACPEQLSQLHYDTLPKTSLYNEYGPTEATVWCTVHALTAEEPAGTVSIGQPIPGTQLFLLDSNLNLVPYGTVGEICIAGAGLSPGYLNNNTLTKSKFVESFFDPIGKALRLYRTGDLGRYRTNGDIEFSGRADLQIKIRGHRVELEEIENALLQFPSITSASVVVDDTSGKQLEAYIISQSDVQRKEALTHLEALLPKHMLPSRIIQTDSFPKLPNGKVDKVSLRKIGQDKLGKHFNIVEEANPETINRPISETEKQLMSIWQEVLGKVDISVDGNFFHIGGDSIMSIKIIAKARKIGLAITPNQLFEHQTIAKLARFLETSQDETEKWDYLVPLRKRGSKVPLFCIHAGGGHVFFYNKLVGYLDPEVPLYALQPSGLYGGKGMHSSIEEMSRAYLDAIREVSPTGPYRILVYCFSAAVGNEMAVMLRELDEKLHLIVMDTMTAPAVLNTPVRLKIRARIFLMRFFKAPIRSVKRMLIAKYSLLRMKWKGSIGPETESRELERLRMNLMRMSQTYEWKSLPGKISLVLTQKDHASLNEETMRSWKEIAQESIHVVHTKGSHQLLFEEPYIKHTARAIEGCLADPL